MPEKVKILGGYSLPGSIYIYSDRYESTASYSSSENTVTVIVRQTRFAPTHPNSRKPSERNNFWRSIPIFYRIGLLFILGLNILKGAGHYFFPDVISASEAEMNWYIYFIFVMSLLAFVRFFIAKWHGAEHMVIDAYIDTGKCDFESTLRSSPISSNCGGRFVIIMFTVLFVTTIFLPPELRWLNSAAILSIFTWPNLVDRRLCCNRVVGALNWFLQRFFTTAEPGVKELTTAHEAMRGLLEAHEEKLELSRDAYQKTTLSYREPLA